MNSIWNKNKALFAERFPQLVTLFAEEINYIEEKLQKSDLSKSASACPESNTENWWTQSEIFSQIGWQISVAKNGSLTASSNGKFLHSNYNPEREAEKLFSAAQDKNAEISAGVFLGVGLGYAPLCFAQKFPQKTLLLVEPEPLRFLAALTLCDWTAVFRQPKVVLALACPPETAFQIINSSSSSSGSGGIKNSAFFCVEAQTQHAREYFAALQTLLERNKNAQATNTATLEKFAQRWQRNSCKNLRQLELCAGVNIYKDKAVCSQTGDSLPFLLVAAGPSLAQVLPALAEFKKRSVVVAVDTALRACLSVGVEPDFIVLTDPQYYAWRHIAGLQSKSSVLLAESAVYPAAFRFACRKTVLCSSLFPLGQFFEKTLGQKGDLGSGGSVASVAWNFAQMCGATEIFCAGLDLAFPKKQTHVPGSTFEEAAHLAATRTDTPDTQNAAALCSPLREKGKNYAGEEVATDKRMKLFAWWFESRLAACPATKTYVLGSTGLAIPGCTPVSAEILLARPTIEKAKADFLAQSENVSAAATQSLHDKFENTLLELKNALADLKQNAAHGAALCRTALPKKGDAGCQKILPQLQKIDRAISASSIKEIASLVFPTERQLEKLFASPEYETQDLRTAIKKSQVIYECTEKAVNDYLRFL